ncbi:MAG: RNA polymerase sigma-70 factor [Gemmatimonadaceae bacterium]|nr:RNA polymerase sigma-70 factor [Gemmatimonadaceae bacterium]
MSTGARRTAEDPGAARCREWFERSVRGDVEAFESLYRYLHGGLRRFAETYVRSPQVAEEIVQDMFLALWQTRASLRLTRSVKGYFYIGVRNRAINYVKRREAERRAGDRLAREEALHEVGNAAEERLTHEEHVAAVRRIVAQLPPRTRQAYVLYYQHELSYAEIAAVMGTAVKAVEKQLARALRHIYQRIGSGAR